MYARLRVAASSPSICLICTHLSRLRRTRPSGERHYAAQAALAARPSTSMNVEPGPSEQGPSTRLSSSHSPKPSKTASGSLKEDQTGKVKQKQALKSTRKTQREAEEAERQRKALAVMGKTSQFTAAIHDTLPHEPTLVDLERLRPTNSPTVSLKYIYPESSSRLHRWSPSDATVERYSATFQGLVETLTQKFSRKQLLRLYKEGRRNRSDVQLGTPRTMASLKTRQDVAGEIIRWLWQWPYISEVTQRRVYLTERSERVFPLGTSEFFLLLGPDGSSLLGLTQSFKVVIKQVVRAEDAFSLVVEGPNYALDRLAVVLTERKKAILSEVVSLDASNIRPSTSPTGANAINPDLLQRISKLSDALVEDRGEGMFRISSRRRRNIESATRLTTRASQQAVLPPPPLLVHLPTMKDTIPGMMFPHTYALFPFELPKVASLPWNWISTGNLISSPSSVSLNETEIIATASGVPSLFRARKVSDWLGQEIPDNMSHLRDGIGRLLSPTGQLRTLHDTLRLHAEDFPDSKAGTGRRRQITASTGYIAFTAAGGSKNTLLPPLPGSWIIPNLLDWMSADKGKITFIPSPPQPLVKSSLSDQLITNQLVYRSLESDTLSNKALTASIESTKTIKIDIMLNTAVQDQVKLATETSSTKSNGETTWNATDRVPLLYTDFIDQESQRSFSASQLQISSGLESFVNVMLPDRPIDMQLSLFDSATVPPDLEPPEIRAYASKLLRYFETSPILDRTARPDPPLHMIYERNRYVLDSNATIRRSSQQIGEIEHPTDVATEHVVDLESDQQTTTCQVICTEPNTIPEWQKFLGDCDRLTWLTVEERAASTFSMHDDNQEIY